MNPFFDENELPYFINHDNELTRKVDNHIHKNSKFITLEKKIVELNDKISHLSEEHHELYKRIYELENKILKQKE